MSASGKVLRLGRRGLIVRSSASVKLGQEAFDGKRRRIGTVSEIFGPVNSPYVVIKPASGISGSQLEKMVGSDILLGETGWKRRKSQ